MFPIKVVYANFQLYFIFRTATDRLLQSFKRMPRWSGGVWSVCQVFEVEFKLRSGSLGDTDLFLGNKLEGMRQRLLWLYLILIWQEHVGSAPPPKKTLVTRWYYIYYCHCFTTHEHRKEHVSLSTSICITQVVNFYILLSDHSSRMKLLFERAYLQLNHCIWQSAKSCRQTLLLSP
jgi:hypothetical protein